MKWIYKLYQKIIIKKYTKVGLQLGDALSYSFMGPIVGFDKISSNFIILENKIASFGILPYDLYYFIQAGGYGSVLPQLEYGDKKEIDFIINENRILLQESLDIQNGNNTIIKKFIN